MSNYGLRFLLAKKLPQDKGRKLSKPIVNISITGVALCIVTMIIAVAITSGYKQEIRDMVVSMGSHIRISNYDNNYSFEPIPIERDQYFLDELYHNSSIENIQFFSTKVGIIKTTDQVEGIILKGIDSTFYWKHFQKNIIDGHKIDISDTLPSQDILISSRLSKKMKIRTGDKVRTYFVQDPPMQRNFTVSGIFETGLPDFDESFALVDLRHVQKLNGWDSTLVGGIEILVQDNNQIDDIGEYVNGVIGYNLKAETMKQIFPQIFEWIALFDTNVSVLLVITIFVCTITMMSTFFIIVLEQTPSIGVLKTMGLRNRDVLSVFLLIASKILTKGLLIGNFIALSLCFLQQYFHFFKLDPKTYYVSYVPVHIGLLPIIGINLGVFLICILVLTIPAYFVAKKISPIKAIRLD